MVDTPFRADDWPTDARVIDGMLGRTDLNGKIVRLTGDVGVEDSMKRVRAVVEDTGDVLNVRYNNLRTLQEAEDARVTAAVVAVMVGLVTMVEEADAKRRAEEAARLETEDVASDEHQEVARLQEIWDIKMYLEECIDAYSEWVEMGRPSVRRWVELKDYVGPDGMDSDDEDYVTWAGFDVNCPYGGHDKDGAFYGAHPWSYKTCRPRGFFWALLRESYNRKKIKTLGIFWYWLEQTVRNRYTSPDPVGIEFMVE